MSVTLVEQAVDESGGGGGMVKVRKGDARIVVSWFCGEHRSFVKDDLLDAIAYLERMKAHPEVHLRLRDSNGETFHARLEGEDLFVENGPDANGRKVPWKDLKLALNRAMKS